MKWLSAKPRSCFLPRLPGPTRAFAFSRHPGSYRWLGFRRSGRLRAGADKTVLGLGIGPTTVGLEWSQNGLRFAWMTQPIPTFGPMVTDTVAVAAAVGVQPCDLAGGGLPVQVASSGVPFLYVPLSSRAAVDGASVERARLCALLHALNLEELPVFVFSPELADDDATVYSRMFAPCFGIPEDPATGAASGPLGAYLLHYNAVPADAASRLVNLQGVRMGRPSRICIALSSRAGVLEEVRVGGEAVVVGEGTLRG